MNTDSYQRQVQQIQSEIARLQKEMSRQSHKIASLSAKISSASRVANRTSNPSTLVSKRREVERYTKERANAEKSLASLGAKLAQLQKKLCDAQENLRKAEAREEKKRIMDANRQSKHYLASLDSMSSKLNEHDELHQKTQMVLKKLTQLPEKITVLFLAANPLDQHKLRLDEEVRMITEMIRKTKHRDSVEFRSVWATRPMDVLQAINEYHPHIVHFSGHGSEQDEIIFQDDSGQSKFVSKEAIVQLMRASSGDIRLVFFNTCFSRNQAEAVVHHVDFAIGMNTSIGDKAARIFASQFYSAIGFGLSVATAFEQAKALVMMEGIQQQDTPELFVRSGLNADSAYLVCSPEDVQADEVVG